MKQLPNQRWGIYAEKKLLATFGCHDNCLKVFELLQIRMMLISRTKIAPVFLDQQAA